VQKKLVGQPKLDNTPLSPGFETPVPLSLNERPELSQNFVIAAENEEKALKKPISQTPLENSLQTLPIDGKIDPESCAE